MPPPYVDGEALARALPPGAAVDALQAAFSQELPDAPARTHVPAGPGELLLMPATGEQGAGVKLVTVNPSNPGRGLPLVQGVYVLFAPETMQPAAVIDGAALTSLRTAAVSGVATRFLARPEARSLVIFGAGVQATAHLEAMRTVRPIEKVVVVSRTAERAEALAARAREAGLRARTGVPDDVEGADIVCTCTTSPAPVLDGRRLQPGAHVNAVGAYTPETRELDDEAVRRGRIVVETRAAALEEAGDLLIPMGSGAIGRDDIVAELSDVVRGASVRRSDEDVTIFKSVGVAFEDLVVAAAVREGLGR